MKAKGFVLIFCLFFVALMSWLLWSVLSVSQLSHLIAGTGARQLQNRLMSEQQLQDFAKEPKPLLTPRQLPNCPAQYAVWHNAPNLCEIVFIQSEAISEQPHQGSVLVKMTVQEMQQ